MSSGGRTDGTRSLGQFEGLIEEKNQNRVMPISVLHHTGAVKTGLEHGTAFQFRLHQMMHDVNTI